MSQLDQRCASQESHKPRRRLRPLLQSRGRPFLGNAPKAHLFAFYAAENATACYLPGTTGWGDNTRPTSRKAMESSRPDWRFKFWHRTKRFRFHHQGHAKHFPRGGSRGNSGWRPLDFAPNLHLTNGSIHFSNPDWANYPTRFYRIRSPSLVIHSRSTDGAGNGRLVSYVRISRRGHPCATAAAIKTAAINPKLGSGITAFCDPGFSAVIESLTSSGETMPSA